MTRLKRKDRRRLAELRLIVEYRGNPIIDTPLAAFAPYFNLTENGTSEREIWTVNGPGRVTIKLRDDAPRKDGKRVPVKP